MPGSRRNNGRYQEENGSKGTTYQVRYASKAAKGGYAYATFDTLKEARAFLESGETKKHKAPRSSEIKTVDSAITKWLDICEKEGRDDRGPVSPSTLENYEWRSRTMKAYDWPCALQDVREADVIDFRSWLKKNCTTDQAQKVLSSFHSVLIEMQKRDIITHDPAQDVTLRANPRDKEPVQIPTLEEFRAILAAADRLANSKNNEIASAWERYRPMIYLAADSGMRPQEYLVLPPEALLKNGVEVIQALDRSNRHRSSKDEGRTPLHSGQLALA